MKDYGIIDADNHYYEALDAFTRHLDPRHGERVIQWAQVNGRSYHVLGGRVNHAVTNPTFDPVSPPGAMAEYFRGNSSGRNPLEYLREREPIRPAYRDRDARLATMDEQGLEQIWLYPTLGMLYEEALKDDPGAVALLFQAFNRWIEEDWGYGYSDRIWAAPYITLAEVGVAVQELERALSLGARSVVLRAAAPVTAGGQVPASDEAFDPFWARAHEAGITVVVHAGDAGATATAGYAGGDFSTSFKGAGRPRITSLTMERSIHDFLASLLFDKLFERFPNLRIASVENGAQFLPGLFKGLQSASRKMPGYWSEDPVETFKRHVWINPFWEDDVHEVVDLMGADRVLFGSDWPHIEGMPSPLDYLGEIKELDEDTQRKILRDNALELMQLRP
ncbi:MAG: putative TIM-barrel fold metal-dependent hydrolase [Frankiales bacterium]|nr:putative TIM-barrel fold metal-dependent hydrolase [Frankiales bacterium]